MSASWYMATVLSAGPVGRLLFRWSCSMRVNTRRQWQSKEYRRLDWYCNSRGGTDSGYKLSPICVWLWSHVAQEKSALDQYVVKRDNSSVCQQACEEVFGCCERKAWNASVPGKALQGSVRDRTSGHTRTCAAMAMHGAPQQAVGPMGMAAHLARETIAATLTRLFLFAKKLFLSFISKHPTAADSHRTPDHASYHAVPPSKALTDSSCVIPCNRM